MSNIDHRTKQVIFTRQDSGDFEIQVQREKCVRVEGEAFVRFDRAVDVLASERLLDEVIVGPQKAMTLGTLLQVVESFAQKWDAGNRTRSLLLLSDADRPYSLICYRESLSADEWIPANAIVKSLTDIAAESVTVADIEYTVAECAVAVRRFCDLWAGD